MFILIWLKMMNWKWGDSFRSYTCPPSTLIPSHKKKPRRFGYSQERFSLVVGPRGENPQEVDMMKKGKGGDKGSIYNLSARSSRFRGFDPIKSLLGERETPGLGWAVRNSGATARSINTSHRRIIASETNKEKQNKEKNRPWSRNPKKRGGMTTF